MRRDRWRSGQRTLPPAARQPEDPKFLFLDAVQRVGEILDQIRFSELYLEAVGPCGQLDDADALEEYIEASVQIVGSIASQKQQPV